MEKGERVDKLEEEMKMLIDKSHGLDKEMRVEITRALIPKAKEYYSLTGDFYRVKERDLW